MKPDNALKVTQERARKQANGWCLRWPSCLKDRSLDNRTHRQYHLGTDAALRRRDAARDLAIAEKCVHLISGCECVDCGDSCYKAVRKLYDAARKAFEEASRG